MGIATPVFPTTIADAIAALLFPPACVVSPDELDRLVRLIARAKSEGR